MDYVRRCPHAKPSEYYADSASSDWMTNGNWQRQAKKTKHNCRPSEFLLRNPIADLWLKRKESIELCVDAVGDAFEVAGVAFKFALVAWDDYEVSFVVGYPLLVAVV